MAPMAPGRPERRPMSSQTKRTMSLFQCAKTTKPPIKKPKVPMQTPKSARPTRFQGFKPRTPQIVDAPSPLRAKGDEGSGEQEDSVSPEAVAEYVRISGEIGRERMGDQDQAEVEAEDVNDEEAIASSEVQGQAGSKFQLPRINASLATPATGASREQEITSKVDRPNVNTSPLRTYAGSRSILASQATPTELDEEDGEGGDQDQDFIADAFDDEGLDSLDRELLGEVESSQASPRILTSEQPLRAHGKNTSGRCNISSKSPRSKRQHDDDDDEDTEHDTPESQPKRRRSNRDIPIVTKRKTALRKLKAERQSKGKTNFPSVASTSKSKKKKSTTTKRKHPREIPEEGLIIVAERIDDAEFDSDGDDVLEVLEDPISQVSPIQYNSSRPKRRKRVEIVKYTIKPKKGWAIDPAQFRIPKPQNLSPRSQRRNQRIPSYSDGFEGKEAQPIGRPMIIQQPGGHRQRAPETFAFDMPELTLVREKYQEEPVKKSSKKKRQKPKETGLSESEYTEALLPIVEDAMLIDGHVEEQLPNEHNTQSNRRITTENHNPVGNGTTSVIDTLRAQPTPVVDTKLRKELLQCSPPIPESRLGKAIASTPPARSANTRALREPPREAVGPPNSTPVARATQERLSLNLFSSQTRRASTMLDLKRATKQQRQTAKQKDIEASQQLSMVFISRPIYSDSSDESDDTEDEDEAGDEEDTEEEENENGEGEANEDYEEANHYSDGKTRATSRFGIANELQMEDEGANNEELSAEIGINEPEKNQDYDSDNNIALDDEEEQAFQIVTEDPFISKIEDLHPQHSKEEVLSERGVDGQLADNETAANKALDSRMSMVWLMINDPPLSSRVQTLRREESSFLEALQPATYHKENIRFVRAQPSLDANSRSNDLGTQYQQPTQQHESPDSGAHQEHIVNSVQDTLDALHSDDSWRPKAPHSSSVLMEVEGDDIVDSPNPTPTAEILAKRRLSRSRKVGGTASMLTFVHSRQSSDLDATPFSTQPTQPPLHSKTSQSQQPSFGPEVPETQFVRPEDRESQQSYIPTPSYFDRASQVLSKYKHTTPSRTKSVPHRFGDPVLVIPVEPASSSLGRDSTPMRGQDRLGTLYRRPSTPQPSLKALTRQASFSLGTIPTRPSGQRRTMTVTNPHFAPPTYKQQDTVPRASIPA
ncbi:hypothetical protein B0J14DRAFT_359139 [Halenospora varia]|nr:hypothetical protein B0J14DRAFT_359139 [Halenospora varia]